MCRLAYSDGQPVIRLDRRRYPDLPSGRERFAAEGVEYEATFAKGTVPYATCLGADGNALPALLRNWFGSSAGHPGTSDFVQFKLSNGALQLRPLLTKPADLTFEYLPLLANFSVAFEPGARDSWSGRAAAEIPVIQQPGQQIAASTHFVCFAHADAMVGGGDALRRGDPMLFKWTSAGSIGEHTDQPVLVEIGGQSDATDALKVIRYNDGRYFLEAGRPPGGWIEIGAETYPVARLVATLDQLSINPLASRIGDQFKSTDVPELYGEVYNPGNWRSGHVSLKNHVIQFVSLHKRADRIQYTEHFESPDVFVWSSQLSTSPERKKGKEILNALETGKSIELWMRRKGNDIAFTYLGRVMPLRHEGSEPMLVTFRLLTPLTSEIQDQLGLSW